VRPNELRDSVRLIVISLIAAVLTSCGGATAEGTTQAPSPRPSLSPMAQELRFSGAISGTLSLAVVPLCGSEGSAHVFTLSMTGKVENRARIGFSLQVEQFAGAGTYSFARGMGFLLIYGPPKVEYHVGSSSLARADTMTVDPGEKKGTVSVAFYNQGGAQQPAVRLVGTWRCQG